MMRIVDRKKFLAMPAGTVFAKFKPCYFEELMVKGETWGNDFTYQDIADAIACTDSGDFADKLDDAVEHGTSVAMDFDCYGRDGCFTPDQLFAVYEQADVEGMIALLQRSLAASQESQVSGREGDHD
jgi:hypothetical protein